MKTFVLLALLAVTALPALADENAIDVKTGGYSTVSGDLKPPIPEAKKPDVVISDKTLQALQPVPNKKIGFWKKFHPDNIETYHPKLNKGWNCYMFGYEHGGRQTLDIASKVACIAFPFVR